jgi:hypothetical protein
MTRRIAALLAAALAVIVTACVPQPNKTACGQPPPEIVSRIDAQLRTTGQVNTPRSSTSEGGKWQFVSVDLRTPEEVRDKKSGNILTFSYKPSDDSTIYAVDARAREATSFEDAPFDVSEDAAVKSRGCVYTERKD